MDPILGTLLGKMGAAAGSKAIAEGVGLLRELVGLEQAQVHLLKSIDGKLDLLVTSPLVAGRRTLEAALAPHRSDADRRELLVEARKLMVTAFSQDSEPMRRSFASLYLALIWLVLGYPEDVPKALRDAHIEALYALYCATRDKETGPFKTLKSIGKAKKNIAHSVTVTSELLPYCNNLALGRRQWGEEEATIFLDLPSEAFFLGWPDLRCAQWVSQHRVEAGLPPFYPAITSIKDNSMADLRTLHGHLVSWGRTTW